MTEPPTFTTADFGTSPLFIHAACHPSAGTRDEYRDGVLHIACRECQKPIIGIAVAGPHVDLIRETVDALKAAAVLDGVPASVAQEIATLDMLTSPHG